MNLPSALRERKDTICGLATLPGPGSPSLDEMNGPMGVVAEELRVLAKDGAFITRTSRFPFGRKVRVLLLHTTGDQPAIRQLCGISAATSTHFCFYCTLTYQERNNIDYKTWRARLWSKEKKYAIAYRDAKTERRRVKLVEAHGLRWSVLQTLGYHNPMRHALPDASHMFARVFQHMIRGVYGMSTRVPDSIGSDETTREAPCTPQQELSEAWLVLRRGNSATVDRLNPKVTRRLMDDIRGEQPDAFPTLARWTKERRIRALKDYVGCLRPCTESNTYGYKESLTGLIRGSKSAGSILTAEEVSKLKSLCAEAVTSGKLTAADMTSDLIWEYFSSRNKTAIERDLDKSALIAVAERCLVPDAGPRARPNPKAVAVLGKRLMAELTSVVHSLKKPSWLPKPTSKPGDPSEGSLKSTALRRLAEVYLPITLIREWGPCAKGSRERRMLENYMHLISASLLAHQRKTRPSLIRKYHREAHRFLETRAELFPEVSVTPYEHIMLHFSWFLERYGPMHSWQQLLMEQRNGDLQKIPTNYKFGELEQTMFQGFGQEQCLRVVLGEELPKVRPEFSGVTDAYSKRFSKDARADLRNHHVPVDAHFHIDGRPGYWDDEETVYLSISSLAFQLLQTWIEAREGPGARVERRVLRHKAITYLGQKFQVKGARTEGDTSLVYQDGRQLAADDVEGLHSTWTPGRIQDIFSHKRQSDGQAVCDTFFVVEPYTELTPGDAKHDFFREFIHWGGRLFYNSPEHPRAPILVSVQEVVCILAHLPMNVVGIRAECVLGLPVRI
ncbi:hypothetical protein FB107DRAFT_224152 [Schizophyllum commune]